MFSPTARFKFVAIEQIGREQITKTTRHFAILSKNSRNVCIWHRRPSQPSMYNDIAVVFAIIKRI